MNFQNVLSRLVDLRGAQQNARQAQSTNPFSNEFMTTISPEKAIVSTPQLYNIETSTEPQNVTLEAPPTVGSGSITPPTSNSTPSSYITLQDWSNAMIDASNQAYRTANPNAPVNDHYTWDHLDYGKGGQTLIDPITGQAVNPSTGKSTGATYSWSTYGNVPNPYLTK